MNKYMNILRAGQIELCGQSVDKARKRNCCWWLIAVLLLCAAPTAEVMATEGAGAKDPPIAATKLNLRLGRAPVPALKYRLLPELRDLKPGNAVVCYYRAFSPEWQYFQRDKAFSKAYEKWSDDRSKTPPRELAFVRNFAALAELDLGARRAYCDWEMIDRLRRDGIMLLLPDIQSFRTYSALLCARARFDMLDREYDKALHGLQTGFTLSRHVSEGPTLIQALVGAAMTNQMIEEIEQLIQQPGAPNLYWALSDLPNHFIDLRKPIQGEKIFIDALFPGWREMLADLKTKPLPPADMEALLKKTHGLESILGRGEGDNEKEIWGTRIGAALLAARSYPEARNFLLDQGRPKELVEQMPVSQVALLYEIHNFDRFFEDMTKWYGQPYPIMRKGVGQAVMKLKEAKANMSAGTVLATLLVPAVEKVFDASYRVDRKLAGLRCVEAIRLYATTHDGKLPASLDNIDEVPVPLDPLTGNRFAYTLGPKGAVLTAPTPPGLLSYYSWSYEITVQP